QDVGALAAWACNADAGDFARYARFVVELAAAGDARAEALLGAAAGHVAAVARALIGDRDDLALILTGGLADTIAPRLDRALRARLTPAVHDAAYGAALLARQASRSSLENY